jgi:hypothetical protein
LLVNRIFPVLALFAVTFMATTLLLGLTIGELNVQATPDTLVRARVHRLCGIAAALSVVLADSIVVTYFVGTSRWCKEVSEAYKLDAQFVRRSTALKRRTFPIAVLSMLTVVGVVALGGAADPAAALRLPPLGGVTWSQLHLAGAMLGLTIVAYAFYLQWENIAANRDVINDILAEVQRIRIEKGLDV